jgi:hypothetical protein
MFDPAKPGADRTVRQSVCTKAAPDPCADLHPDAEDAGECPEGCCDRYHCPNCGIYWTVEGPD